MSLPRDDAKAPRSPKGPFRRVLPLLALVALVGASLYAFSPLGNIGGPGGGQCRAAAALVPALKPLAKGEIAALQVVEKPAPVRPLAFQNADGQGIGLEAFRGKVVVLNLWATWCLPCRKEMPALESLQKQVGGAEFEVVAVNIDTRNFEKPKAFLAEIGVSALGYYADPSARIFQDLKAAGRAFGMPTTLVIDREGCELAWLAGPAEWASDEALTFVRAAIRR